MSHGSGEARLNRLGQELSPYLRQHATNPVDWYPWGPEALERARSLDRPILLSVGYSACHWCHVMAHESFEDPATAGLMNEHFINIKVDREERPDLDQLYQGVVALLGRGGGWPLTVFLTPQLKPFFGGTYFPPQDRYGMPGFPSVLRQLASAYRDRREEVEAQARQFELGLSKLSTYGLEAAGGEIPKDLVVRSARQLLGEVDPKYGGLGGAPKFPNPMSLALLLRADRAGLLGAREAVLLTLERMAQGGIYDQLGGGFHRYSVDERWLVPHFEKMLYDNAQLIHLYAEAMQVAPRPLWQKVVEESCAYVAREMTSPEGLFYAAQDADSEGVEGKYFVWTPGELRAELGPEAADLFAAHHGVTPEGSFEHGHSVLEVREDVPQLARRLGRGEEELRRELEAARAKLLAARQRRVKPGLDDKILTGWNGLMIRGLAFASRVFAREDWALAATRAAEVLLDKAFQKGELLRVQRGGQVRQPGFLEDYGNLALALVTLFETTGQVRFLEASATLADAAQERFWDPQRRAYRAAPAGQGDLLCVPYALHDNAAPSGASTLTQAQLGLAALTGEQRFLSRAHDYLSKLAPEAERNPFAFSHLLLAYDDLRAGPAELVLVGPDAQTRAWAGQLAHLFAPWLHWVRHDPKAPPDPLLAQTLRDRPARDGRPTGYFCRGVTCQMPTTDLEALRQQLAAP